MTLASRLLDVVSTIGVDIKGLRLRLAHVEGAASASAASALQSATTAVDVSAAASPAAGQILTATSGTAATWQTPAHINDIIMYSLVLED